MSHPPEPGQHGTPPNGPQQPPTEPFGWQPGFPIEPVPPANSNKGVLVAIGLVIALGVGLGAFFLFTKKDSTPVAAPPATSSAKSVTSPPKATTTKPKKTERIATAGVGDCVKVNDDSAEDADVAPLDCAKPDAVFKIAKKLASGAETCPTDSDYLEYEESGTLGHGFSLCLMLNAKQGECFTDLDEADQAKKVACADPAVKFEVLEIVDGGTKPEDCASSEVDNGFIYTEPKLVICGKSRK